MIAAAVLALSCSEEQHNRARNSWAEFERLTVHRSAWHSFGLYHSICSGCTTSITYNVNAVDAPEFSPGGNRVIDLDRKIARVERRIASLALAVDRALSKGKLESADYYASAI